MTVSGTPSYSPVGTTVPSVGTTTLSLTFTPSDTTDYTTATTSVSLTVNQATPAITWATPGDISYGTALSSTQLNATASVLGTMTYNYASGTVLDIGANQALRVTLAPTDTLDYTTATDTVYINVAPTATILIGDNTGPYTVTASADSTISVPVFLSNSDYLNAGDLAISYNPAELQLQPAGVSEGSLLTETGEIFNGFNFNIDSTAGTVPHQFLPDRWSFVRVRRWRPGQSFFPSSC